MFFTLRITTSIFLILCSVVSEVENLVCLLASAHSRECNKAVLLQSSGRSVLTLQITYEFTLDTLAEIKILHYIIMKAPNSY